MKRIALSLVILIVCFQAFANDQPVRPAISGIAYARIAATNMETSRGFYAKELGLAPNSAGCRSSESACFTLNGSQFVVFDTPSTGTGNSTSLLTEVGFGTTSAAGLQRYLVAHGIKTSEISKSEHGMELFTAVDPEGHQIAFVQPRSREGASAPSQVSARLIHAGFVVHDRAAEDKFYKDILGFHVYWHGGMKEGEDNWVDMQVPDGTDWIEYMLRVSPDASHKTLGVMNHIALGVPDIHAAQQQLIKNGWKGTEEPKIGRDGKWQLNLYDPDETRVELMEFKPTKDPCCSPYTGPHPGPPQ
jgi:catechol 2,3-dioxygenase-like lactoylglutathione lyase family enzyme